MRRVSRRYAINGLAMLAATAAVAAVSRRAVAEDLPLAIQGYDPVAYFADGRPVRGLADFEYAWDERRAPGGIHRPMVNRSSAIASRFRPPALR